MYLWRGSLITKHCRLKPGFLYQKILQGNYKGILDILQTPIFLQIVLKTLTLNALEVLYFCKI